MAEKYYRNLSKQIYNIQGKIVNISLIIEGIQQSLEIMLRERNGNDNICYSDSNDNEISLPLTEYTEFDALNKQLSSEVNFRQKIVSSKHVSSIVRPVLDHYVLVSGGGVRVSDVTRVGV